MWSHVGDDKPRKNTKSEYINFRWQLSYRTLNLSSPQDYRDPGAAQKVMLRYCCRLFRIPKREFEHRTRMRAKKTEMVGTIWMPNSMIQNYSSSRTCKASILCSTGHLQSEHSLLYKSIRARNQNAPGKTRNVEHQAGAQSDCCGITFRAELAKQVISALQVIWMLPLIRNYSSSRTCKASILCSTIHVEDHLEPNSTDPELQAFSALQVTLGTTCGVEPSNDNANDCWTLAGRCRTWAAISHAKAPKKWQSQFLFVVVTLNCGFCEPQDFWRLGGCAESFVALSLWRLQIPTLN